MTSAETLFSVAGKRALVTGGATGVGRMIAQALVMGGAEVMIASRKAAACDRAAHEISALGLAGRIEGFVGDVSTAEGVDALVAQVTDRAPQLDILVNNAGIGVAGRLDNVPRDQWESLMQLNLLAPMRLCNLFVPGMIERGSGHIVNVSSIAGWLGSQGLSAYCASKFGLRGFGVALAADLEGTGVHVTNVYPCFSQTAILDSPQYGYEERRAAPAYLISEPSDVVARMIDGVRRNLLHVFPDKHARRIHYITRFAPWLVPMLDRRMQAQSIEAGKEAD